MAVLTAATRNDLDEDRFAFPSQRKEPLENLSHARNAMARLNQVQGVSDEERAAARRRIVRALKKFGADEYQGHNGDDVREDAAPLGDGDHDADDKPPAADAATNGDGDVDDAADDPDPAAKPETVTGAGADVRETSSMTLPAEIPDRIPVRFMTAGPGNRKDNNFYTPDAVQALAACIKAQPKMYRDHSLPSEVRERGHRSLADLAGIAVKETVHYNPMTQACEGEVILHPQFRDYIRTANLAGDTIGLSVDALGDFAPGSKKCRGWKQFFSVDFVPKGGAGGFNLPVRESESLTPQEWEEERAFTMLTLTDMTPEEVREAAPEVYEAIVAAEVARVRESAPVAVPMDAEKLVRESDAYAAVVRENEALKGANEALTSRVDAIEAEANRVQTAEFVVKTIRECGVNDEKQIAYLCGQKDFAGATVGAAGTYTDVTALSARVREAATEFLAVAKPAAPSGEVAGLGGRSGGGTPAYVNPLAEAKAIDDGIAMSLWGLAPTSPVQ